MPVRSGAVGRVGVAIPVLVAGFLLAGCGDDGGGEVEGLPTVEGAPEVVVRATDFAFEPSTLHLVAGEPVNVVLEVAEGRHDLAVVVSEDERFVLPIVEEGERTRGALTIDQPGTYQLVCLVPGHASEGMIGTVEVAPAEDGGEGGAATTGGGAEAGGSE